MSAYIKAISKIIKVAGNLEVNVPINSCLMIMPVFIGVTDVIAKVFALNLRKYIHKMNNSIKLVCNEISLEVLLGKLAVNKLDALLSGRSLAIEAQLKIYCHLVGKVA